MLCKKLVILGIFFHMPLIDAGKSHVESIFPIIAVLRSAQKHLLSKKTEHPWYILNGQQKLLIEKYLPHVHELGRFLPDELQTCVSDDNTIINQFLVQHDCGTEKVNLFENSKDFGIAVIMNIMGLWQEEGTGDSIWVKDSEYPVAYPAIEIFKKQSCFSVMQTEQGHNIVRMTMRNGDIVSMVVADQERSGFDLLDTIEKLRNAETKDITREYDSVKFPMVDLTCKSDLAWLTGMSKRNKKEDEDATLTQAFQETRLKMDTFGFMTKKPVSINKGPFICYVPMFMCRIEKPFFVWGEREGISLPLFAGYIDTEDWKRPNRICKWD